MASKGVLDFTLDDEELKFQADAAKGPTPVPVGWYNVLITDVSIAAWSKDEPINPKTKKPVREKLVLTVKLSEGEFAGRQIRYVNVPLFQKFNPTAKSPAGTATSFISFMDAVGAMDGNRVTLSAWDELFGKEVSVKIIIGKPKDDGAVYNEIQPFAGVWKPKDDETGDGEGDGISFEEESGFSL